MNQQTASSVTVRVVPDKEQIDSIIRLCDGAFPNPIAQRDTYPAMLDKLDRYGIFFAAGAEEPLGYAAMYANDRVTRTAFMTLMAVRPGYQGMGIGKLLMNRCLACASQHGMEHVRLEVRKDNLRAAAMYEKYGFAPDGSETETSIFLVKPLI